MTKEIFDIEQSTWQPTPLTALEAFLEAAKGAAAGMVRVGAQLAPQDQARPDVESTTAYLEYSADQVAGGREPYTGSRKPQMSVALATDIVMWLHIYLPQMAPHVADGVLVGAATRGLQKGLAKLWQFCRIANRKPDVCVTMSCGDRRAHYHLPEAQRSKTAAMNAMAKDFGLLAAGHRVWGKGGWTSKVDASSRP